MQLPSVVKRSPARTECPDRTLRRCLSERGRSCVGQGPFRTRQGVGDRRRAEDEGAQDHPAELDLEPPRPAYLCVCEAALPGLARRVGLETRP